MLLTAVSIKHPAEGESDTDVVVVVVVVVAEVDLGAWPRLNILQTQRSRSWTEEQNQGAHPVLTTIPPGSFSKSKENVGDLEEENIQIDPVILFVVVVTSLA